MSRSAQISGSRVAAWTVIAVSLLAGSCALVGSTGSEGASDVNTLVLNDFRITGPEEIPAGSIVFTVINEGVIAHDLVVRRVGLAAEELSTPELAAGDQVEFDVTSLDPGDYEFYCAIEGHLQAGMAQGFVVTSSD